MPKETQQFSKDYYFQLPNHPGIDPMTLMPTPAESFEGFKTFVNTRGLNPKTKRAFSSLLAGLFDRTGNIWLPGYCTWAAEIATQTRDLTRQLMPSANVAAMLYPKKPYLHVWTRLELPNQTFLAIDPAGVLNKEQRILPYFGPISPCILNRTRLESTEQVYINSIPLSSVQENNLVATASKYFPK